MKLRHLAIAIGLAFISNTNPSQAQFKIDFPPPQITAPLITPVVPHQFVTGYPILNGTLSQAQPDFTDITGVITSAQCPNGTTSSTGCLEAGAGLIVTSGILQLDVVNAPAHEFFNSVSSGGILQAAQPTLNDISAITASFTGLIDDGSGGVGTVLTVTGITEGVIFPGLSVFGPGVTSGTIVLAQTGGVIGGIGTYTVNLSQLVAVNILTGFDDSLILAHSGGLQPYPGTTCTLPQFINALSLKGEATCNTPSVDFSSTPLSGQLAGMYGGTGVNNSGKTITLGANLITTGAGAPTLAFPSSPATYTFPSGGGNIVTSAGTNTLFLNLNTAPFPSSLATGTSFGIASADSTAAQQSIVSANAVPVVRVYRSNNTIAAPSVLTPNDVLGQYSYSGWDGSVWGTSSARLRAVSTDTWTTSAHGTQFEIAATPTGSNAIQTEAVFQNGIAAGAGTPKGIGTVNAPNGLYEGNAELIIGGNITTTGIGPITLAFPSSSITYTYPSSSETLVGRTGSVLDVGTYTATFGGNLVTGGALTTTGSGPTTLAFPSASRTYTFPSANDTLVGRNSTDTLTNKSIDASEINSGSFASFQQINTNTATFPSTLSAGLSLGLLAVDGDSTQEGIVSAANTSFLRLYRTNGTIASQMTLVPTNIIGALSFAGWDGTAWTGSAARISAHATDTWSLTNHGTSIWIEDVPSTTAALQTEAIFQDGMVLGAGSSKGLGTVNAVNGLYEGNNELTMGGNLITGGAITTTGAGPVIMAFPGSSVTYTFPTVSATLIGGAVSNTFTQTQIIKTNAAAFPAISGISPLLDIMANDGVASGIAVVSSATSTTLRQVRVNNTVASPGTLTSGDAIGNIAWSGYDGTAYTTTAARIQGVGTETWNTGAHGTEVLIQTTPSGSNTLQTDVTIQNGLALGSGTPQGIGVMNAPNGYNIGSSNVISSSKGAILTSLVVSSNTAAVPSLQPAVAVFMDGDSTSSAINLVSSASSGSGRFRFYRSLGTVASPSPPTSGTILGGVTYGGWTGASWLAATGVVDAMATETTWAASTVGTLIRISATPTGTNTPEIEATFQNGIAAGSGVPQGVGNVNAPNGFNIGSTNVISSLGAGIFPGGLTATIASSGASLSYVCYNSSTGVFTYNATTCH